MLHGNPAPNARNIYDVQAGCVPVVGYRSPQTLTSVVRQHAAHARWHLLGPADDHSRPPASPRLHNQRSLPLLHRAIGSTVLQPVIPRRHIQAGRSTNSPGRVSLPRNGWAPVGHRIAVEQCLTGWNAQRSTEARQFAVSRQLPSSTAQGELLRSPAVRGTGGRCCIIELCGCDTALPLVQ